MESPGPWWLLRKLARSSYKSKVASLFLFCYNPGMRNPDALERRHVPMSLGRKLALAGSIGLAAVGVGGVIYEAKSIIDLRDQQHEDGFAQTSLTPSQRLSQVNERASEVTETATIYLGAVLVAIAGLSGAGILISDRRNSSL